MKIKLFEAFNMSDFYKKVSQQQWEDDSLIGSVDISKTLLTNLKSKLETYCLLKVLEDEIDTVKTYINIVVPFDEHKKDERLEISIFQNEDEWFYVRVERKLKYLHGIKRKRYREYWEYYKCDQEEGVVKLLEDLKLINLKTFESYKSSDYYKKITEDEYYVLCPYKNVEFTEEEYEKLAELSKWGIDYTNDEYDTVEINDYQITKIEDEYFIVSFPDGRKQWDKVLIYYKCDQFEGLLKFLKSKKLI